MVDELELRARLAANKARLRRKKATERMQSFAVFVAGIADRFAIHWYDDVYQSASDWANASVPLRGPYADRLHFVDDNGRELEDGLALFVARHGLGGWAEIFGGFDSHEVAISIETAAIAAFVPKLRTDYWNAFCDTVIVSRSRAWCLMVHHEGDLFYWAFETPDQAPA